MTLQAFDLEGKPPQQSEVNLDTDQTSLFLKAIAHEGRLSILCRLAEVKLRFLISKNCLMPAKQQFHNNWRAFAKKAW